MRGIKIVAVCGFDGCLGWQEVYDITKFDTVIVEYSRTDIKIPLYQNEKP